MPPVICIIPQQFFRVIFVTNIWTNLTQISTPSFEHKFIGQPSQHFPEGFLSSFLMCLRPIKKSRQIMSPTLPKFVPQVGDKLVAWSTTTNATYLGQLCWQNLGRSYTSFFSVLFFYFEILLNFKKLQKFWKSFSPWRWLKMRGLAWKPGKMLRMTRGVDSPR